LAGTKRGEFPDVVKKKFETLRKKNDGIFKTTQRWQPKEPRRRHVQLRPLPAVRPKESCWWWKWAKLPRTPNLYCNVKRML
jgi:hypothetical protein